MAKMQGYNPGLSNEMLTLWLKARDGLSCEEARDLIERLHREEIERAEGAEAAEAEREKDAQAADDERDAAYEAGQRDMARDVQRALDDGPNDEAACDAIQKLVAA